MMRSILKAQALQHSAFANAIVEHGGREDIVHDAMSHDLYWSKELPRIWKTLSQDLSDNGEETHSNKKSKHEVSVSGC